MTTPLNEEQRKQIELEAKASSKMYFSNGCENFEWVTYEDGFINAATAYTLLCQQKDEEIYNIKDALSSSESIADGLEKSKQLLDEEIARLRAAIEKIKQDATAAIAGKLINTEQKSDMALYNIKWSATEALKPIVNDQNAKTGSI